MLAIGARLAKPHRSKGAEIVPSVCVHLDGLDTLWAIARCDRCSYVEQHPAFEAVQFSIQCSRCGHSMDVRELILDDAANHPRISTSIVARLRAATRIGP